MLSKHNHDLNPEWFHQPQKETSYLSAVTPFFSPHHLATIHLLSASTNFLLLYISYKWHHLLCGIWPFLPSTFSKFIGVIACHCTFSDWIIFHCMDIQWLFLKYSNLWTKIHTGYLGPTCPQPKAKKKDERFCPSVQSFLLQKGSNWSFLDNKQEFYLNLLGLNKLLLQWTPPATARGEVPSSRQAAAWAGTAHGKSPKGGLLPPLTRKETMALRDKATSSGSAAAMPMQVCLLPQPPSLSQGQESWPFRALDPLGHLETFADRPLFGRVF